MTVGNGLSLTLIGQRFLWVVHVLNSMRTLRTEKDVRTELKRDRLPKSIEELYDPHYQILTREERTESDRIAARAMELLFCAKKQLSSSAFVDALRAVYPRALAGPLLQAEDYGREIKNLVASCQGFIVHDQELDVLRFQHPSVEQYLRRKKHYDVQAHRTLAEACLACVRSSISRRNSFESKQPMREPDNQEERGRPRSRTSDSKSSSDSYRIRSILEGAVDYPKGERRTSSSPSEDAVLSWSPSRLSDRSGSRPSTRSGSEDRSEEDSDVSEIGGPTQRSAGRGRIALAGPMQDFHDYATLFWPTHCLLSNFAQVEAEEEEPLMRDLIRDLLLDRPRRVFNVWITNVQKLLSQRPFGFYDEEVERQLEHCISPKPTPFQVSCVCGFKEVVRTFCGTGGSDASNSEGSVAASPEKSLAVLPALENIKGITGLHMACRFGRTNTIRFFATLPTDEKDFSAKDKQGKSAMQHAVETTKDIAIVKALLRTPASKFRSHGAVLEAALKNPWCGEDLLRLLIKFGTRAQKEVKPMHRTEGLTITAITCPFSNVDLVKAVSDRKDLTPMVLIMAAGSGYTPVQSWSKRELVWRYVMKSPFLNSKDVVGRESITVNMLERALKAGDVDLVAFLIQHGDPPLVSEGVMDLAASNKARPYDLVEALLRNRRKVQIGAQTLLAALRNSAADDKLVSKLCTHFTEAVAGDQLMLEAVAKHREHGVDMLGTMLAAGVKFEGTVSADFLRDVANRGNPTVLKLMLESGVSRQESRIDLDQMVLDASEERRLRRFRDKYTTIAEKGNTFESESPEENWDDLFARSLEVILHFYPDVESQITQDLIEKAVSMRGGKAIEILLDRASHGQNGKTSIDISKKMVVAAAGNTRFGQVLLPLLESRAPDRRLPYNDDPEVLRVAAGMGSLGTIAFLLGKGPLAKYSPEFSVSAAGNPEPAVVEFVFRRVDPGTIGVKELEAAAENSDETLESLLRRFPPELTWPKSDQLGENIAQYCRRIKHLHAFPKTAGLMMAAIQNTHSLEMASYILDRNRMTQNPVMVSEKMLRTAAGNLALAPEMLRLLLNECEDRRVEQLITADVLVAATVNPKEACEALRILLLELEVDSMDEAIWARLQDAAKDNRTASTDILALLRQLVPQQSLLTNT
jgi:ankyrin repeat protein